MVTHGVEGRQRKMEKSLMVVRLTYVTRSFKKRAHYKSSGDSTFCKLKITLGGVFNEESPRTKSRDDID